MITRIIKDICNGYIENKSFVSKKKKNATFRTKKKKKKKIFFHLYLLYLVKWLTGETGVHPCLILYPVQHMEP